MAEESKTPLADQLEEGSWPSFVKEIKKRAEVNPAAKDLLGQLELSYEEKRVHWKHGGIVGVRGYGGGVIGRYSDSPERFPNVAVLRQQSCCRSDHVRCDGGHVVSRFTLRPTSGECLCGLADGLGGPLQDSAPAGPHRDAGASRDGSAGGKGLDFSVAGQSYV